MVWFKFLVGLEGISSGGVLGGPCNFIYARALHVRGIRCTRWVSLLGLQCVLVSYDLFGLIYAGIF